MHFNTFSRHKDGDSVFL